MVAHRQVEAPVPRQGGGSRCLERSRAIRDDETASARRRGVFDERRPPGGLGVGDLSDRARVLSGPGIVPAGGDRAASIAE